VRDLEVLLGGRGAGFEAILDSLAEAVTIRDHDDRIRYANRAALRQMGFATLEQLQRRPAGSIMADYLVTGEHGATLTMDDIPSVRLLRGLKATPLLIRTVHRGSGALRWNVLKASAVRDEGGTIVATAMISEDVTVVKNAELRSRLLAETGRRLASSPDYPQTLRSVARGAVPQIADWCRIDLVDDRGQREDVVTAHHDPARAALAERLCDFAPEQLDPEHAVGQVVRTGVATLHPDVSDEMLVAAAVDEEHLGLLRELALRSLLIVAIRTAGRVLGTLSLGSVDSCRRFGTGDVSFASQLADRIAVAVENARLYRVQSEAVVTLQRSLLPERVPRIDGWQVAAMYRPAGSEPQVEVGGDFYDFLETDAGWLVMIGDVTGKGVQAAALTSLMRHGARFISQSDPRPAAILQGLDRALQQHAAIAPCTALCMLLGDDRLTMCSAGHPMPLAVSAQGEVRELGTSQLLLGISVGHRWRDQEVVLEAGETVVLHTDGITDVRGTRDRFGEQRLRAALRREAGRAPAELLERLDATLAGFQVGPQPDDTAMIVLRRRFSSFPHDCSPGASGSALDSEATPVPQA
jgi:hypothetical protein